MAINDPLGDHFKAVEKQEERRITSDYAAIRLDGRSFHTLTKNMEKPFDPVFVNAMDAAMLAAANSYQNIRLAYVQSDEISLILERGVEYPFIGRADKLITLAASAAAAAFALTLPAEDVTRPPLFDGRIIPLHDVAEVRDYLGWRRLDCMRNAVNACCNVLYSREELEGRSLEERHSMLAGTRFDPIDDALFHGRFLHRVTYWKQVANGPDVERTRWKRDVASREAVERIL